MGRAQRSYDGFSAEAAFFCSFPARPLLLHLGPMFIAIPQQCFMLMEAAYHALQAGAAHGVVQH